MLSRLVRFLSRVLVTLDLMMKLLKSLREKTIRRLICELKPLKVLVTTVSSMPCHNALVRVKVSALKRPDRR
jgi:hypothetical protein